MADTLTSGTEWGVRLPNGQVATKTRDQVRIITRSVAAAEAVRHDDALLRAGSAERAVVVRRDVIVLRGDWTEAEPEVEP